MIQYLISACIALVALCTSCAGSKTQEDRTTDSEDLLSEVSDVELNEDDDEDISSDEDAFYVKPLSIEVEGPLAGIVTIVDKPYQLEESDALEKVYALAPEFKIVAPQKINGTIDIEGILYDENDNPISFDYEFESMGSSYSTEKHSSFSNGFLQKAIAKNQTCKKASVLIRVEHIKDFNPDMLKAAKSFKIFSKIDPDEFDYDNDLYD